MRQRLVLDDPSAVLPLRTNAEVRESIQVERIRAPGTSEHRIERVDARDSVSSAGGTMLKSGEAMSSRWSFLSCCWSFVDITASHWTIRGAGSDKVILSFKGQATGGAGLKATGDQLRLRGFVVEDTAGNAIKVLAANGVTFRW